MGINIKTSIRQLAMLLMLLAIAMPSFAQQPTLDKNDQGYYIINSDEDYETFCQIVATGNPYANAVLTANITVSEPIGSGDPQFHYRGTFDGQGFTVTMQDDTSDDDVKSASCAMFDYTAPGCVIRNLRLTGNVVAPEDAECVASIVRDATCVRIENCVSEVTVAGKVDCIGGLVGVTHGECFIENSAYIGKILPGLTSWTATSDNIGCIVGKNSEMLNMKSCYSAPVYETQNVLGTERCYIYTGKTEGNETRLNNYFCNERGAYGSSLKTEGQAGTSVKEDDLENGTLCYLLNKNGKKGVVWYQHGGFPFPFKGSDGQLMVSSDEEGHDIHAAEQCECGAGHESSYCQLCGSAPLNHGYIEPLENSGHTFVNKNILWQDNIQFTFRVMDDVATVSGIHGTDNHVSAIHIPESVMYNGSVYNVTSIANEAFANNEDIRSCYIPKSIRDVGDNAFANCKNLEMIYIEDSEETLLTSGNSFNGCPAKTLYIGRDLAWEANRRGLFTNVKTDRLFFGPRVTRIGNMKDNSDHWDFGLITKGDVDDFTNTEAFEEGIFYMGDEKSFNSENSKLTFTSISDNIRHTHEVYYNRDLNQGHLMRRDENVVPDNEASMIGIHDLCHYVTIGPFVKKIQDYAFGSPDYDAFQLDSIYLANAFNLEEIGVGAFIRCASMNEVLDFSRTKLKTINKDAFKRNKALRTVKLGNHLTTINEAAFLESSLKNINIPGSVNTLGAQVFAGCKNLSEVIFEDSEDALELKREQFVNTGGITYVYLGRPLDYTKKSGSLSSHEKCVWSIGPNVTLLDGSIFERDDYESMHIMYADAALKIDKNLNVNVKSLFIDRDLCNSEETGSVDVPIVAKSAGSLNALSFGSNIKEIKGAMFRHLPGIKNLIIPNNITHIGSLAFEKCTGLEFLSIMGSPKVDNTAFVGCENLKEVFLMGNNIEVGEAVFQGCHKIENVYTGFVMTPNINSHSAAFDKETYDKAILVYPGRPEVVKMIEPWSLFKKTESAYKNTKIFSDDEFCNTDTTVCDRAYLRHIFPVNCYDLVSMPFDMDSYYFGSNATILRLNRPEEERFKETATIDDLNRYRTNTLEFSKVSISDDKTLKRGETYLVKLDHAEHQMSAYHNLYDSEKVTVNKEMAVTYASETNNYMSEYTRTFDECTFVPFIFDEGVIKRVNGDYVPQNATPILYGVNVEQQEVFNLKEEYEDNVLMTSKSDLGFDKNLEGYSSFHDAEYNHIAPDWCEVYVVTGTENEKLVLEQIPDRTITKGQAVLLKTDKDVTSGQLTEYLTYTTHGSTATELYDKNILKGVSVETPANQLSPDQGFVYVLSYSASKPNGTTGFYKLSGDRPMPVGKAYIDPSRLEDNLQAKECLFMSNDSQSTGIRMPRTGNRGLNAIYDIMGRRLQEVGDKGIYIINNKKISK